MNTKNHKPAIVQSNEGRKMIVLGQEITLKLASTETGGAYYLFEDLVPPGLGVPPHIHEREDEVLKVIDGEFEFFSMAKLTRQRQVLWPISRDPSLMVSATLEKRPAGRCFW